MHIILHFWKFNVSGTQKQSITALEHIEKIVIVKYKYFLKPSQDAKVPRYVDIFHAVIYLYAFNTQKQTSFRHTQRQTSFFFH